MEDEHEDKSLSRKLLKDNVSQAEDLSKKLVKGVIHAAKSLYPLVEREEEKKEEEKSKS